MSLESFTPPSISDSKMMQFDYQLNDNETLEVFLERLRVHDVENINIVYGYPKHNVEELQQMEKSDKYKELITIKDNTIRFPVRAPQYLTAEKIPDKLWALNYARCYILYSLKLLEVNKMEKFENVKNQFLVPSEWMKDETEKKRVLEALGVLDRGMSQFHGKIFEIIDYCHLSKTNKGDMLFIIRIPKKDGDMTSPYGYKLFRDGKEEAGGFINPKEHPDVVDCGSFVEECYGLSDI